MVLTHEFRTSCTWTRRAAAPLGLRNVFGRLWPSFPNAMQPTWIIEGLAVYTESDVAQGYGSASATRTSRA